VQKPTGYAARGATFKLAAATGSSGLLTGTYQIYEQMDVPRYDSFLSSAYPGSKYLEYTYDPQKRSLAYLRSRQGLSFLGRPTMEATVSYHRQDEGRRYISVPKPGKPEIVVRERDQVSTVGLQFQGQWGSDAGQTVVMGTETYRDQIASARQDTEKPTGKVTKKQGSFPDDTRYLTSALYSRWSRSVARGATLHLGGRYNVFAIRSDLTPLNAGFGKLTETYAEPTGEVRLMLRPQDWSARSSVSALSRIPAVYVGVGRAFRAPNAYDLTAIGTFNAGVEVPNPKLRPERDWTYEVGVKSLAGHLSYQGRLFVSDLVDLVVRERGIYQGQDSLGSPGSRQPVWVKRNAGHGQMKGCSGEVRWEGGSGLWVGTNASYARGQNLRDHEPLSRVPPWNGRVALGRTWERLHLDLAATTDWAAAQRRLSSGDRADTRIPQGGTPGFAVLGLSGRWQARPWAELGLRLENLLNKDYRVHGSGVNGGGRSITVDVRLARTGTGEGH
jgi:outer membrane receptor protein involved in Fe transport